MPPYNDPPCCYSNTALGTKPGVKLKIADYVYGIQTGSYGLGCLVFIGVRPAKVGQHTITQKPDDKAPVSVDRCDDSTLVHFHFAAKFFRVDRRRSCGGTHHVTEKNRKNAPLYTVACPIDIKQPDFLQNCFSVDQAQYTNFEQILAGQFGQNIKINTVSGKLVGKLGHTDSIKPSGDGGLLLTCHVLNAL